MSGQPFDSPFAVLERAGVHLEAVARVMDEFLSNHVQQIVEDDEAAGETRQILRMIGDPPLGISLLVKDTLSNLRDALDHAVAAAAISLRGDVDLSKTAFPIGKDAAAVEKRLKELPAVPSELHPVLKRFGNDILVDLNNARNKSTHRLIVPTPFVDLGSGWVSTNEVVHRMPLGSRWKMMGVVFELGHGSRRLVTWLRDFQNEVQRVVEELSKETQKILSSRTP